MRKTFFLFPCLLLLGACGGGPTNPAEEDAGTQMAEQVSIFSSKDNQKEWLLQADSVDFAGMEKATLKNPQLLLNENGRQSLSVSGQTGIFDYTQKRVTIEGNAKIVSYVEDAQITAPAFFYRIEDDKIWSEARTVITRGTARTVARGGIQTDSKLSKISIKKQSTRVPKTQKEISRKK